MRFRILAIALTIFALNYTRVNLCAAAAPEKQRNKVRISQSAVNTRSAIFWIAQGRGFFAESGLDVETIYLRSSNLQMGRRTAKCSLAAAAVRRCCRRSPADRI